MPYRVLVTGSRAWTDCDFIWRVLDELLTEHPEGLLLREGGARGADRCAARWADGRRRAQLKTEEADWRRYPHAAGFIRNQKMLDLGVDEVIAFKRGFDYTLRSGGTEDMVRRAKGAGVPYRVFPLRSDAFDRPAVGPQQPRLID
jgi:hypothetical protein